VNSELGVCALSHTDRIRYGRFQVVDVVTGCARAPDDVIDLVA
jgi:hypothetical protein